MKNITNEIMGSDVHLKVKGSKLTRLDLLLNKLENMSKYINPEKITTVVYEKDEFVEKVNGTINDTKEILEYYSENFAIDLSIRRDKNEIIVQLKNPIKKTKEEINE